MRRVFDWGFPKEAESCGWKDLWRAWYIGLTTWPRCEFYFQIIIPVGRFVIQLSEIKSSNPAHRFLGGTGWYHFIIRIHLLSYVNSSIHIPLGKWRKVEHEPDQH